MNIESEIAVVQFLDGDGVIQILCVLAVDGDRQKITKIASAILYLLFHFQRIGINRQRLDFLKNLIRECHRQTVLS